MTLIRESKTLIYKLIFKLDLFVSKLVYKNNTGAKLNYLGQSRWNKNKKLYNSDYMSYSESIKEGFHFFKISDDTLIKSIRKKYQEVIQDSQETFFIDKFNYRVNEPQKSVSSMVKNPVKSIPEIVKLLHEDVLQYIYTYYQSHFKLTHVSAYRTHPLDDSYDEEVYAFNLHYDRHATDTLKLFINLSDVTSQDGPFNFFNRRSSKMLLKKGYRDRLKYGKAEHLINDPNFGQYLIGPVGTGLICDTTTCLHRATIPEKNRQRDLIVFSFESSDLPLNVNCEKTINELKADIEKEYSKSSKLFN